MSTKRAQFKFTKMEIIDGSSPENSIEVIFGDEGSVSWTRSTPRLYEKDRGTLDTVIDDEEEPLTVDVSGRWSYIRGSGPTDVTMYDALHGEGSAGPSPGADWTSVDDTVCSPYAVDLVFTYEPDCTPDDAGEYAEKMTFPQFRIEEWTGDISQGSSTISFNGSCNVVKPDIERYDHTA